MRYRLNEWVFVWLRSYKRIMLKPSTYDSYMTYAVNVSCEKYLDELTSIDIQFMINDMVGEGKALSTIKHMLTLVRQSLRKARQLGLIDNLSCMDMLELPKASHRQIEAFTDKQIQLILSNSFRTYYGDLYKALLYTGCRVGELIALRWSDVDWFNSRLYIRHTDYHGELQAVKTDNGNRVIPIYGELEKLLRERYRGRSSGAQRVFINTLGQPVKYRTLLDNWHWFCDHVGLQPTGLHVFRHTFAHIALRSGVPIKVVSAWLGHADVSITLNIYDSVTAEDLARSADQLSKGMAQ